MSIFTRISEALAQPKQSAKVLADLRTQLNVERLNTTNRLEAVSKGGSEHRKVVEAGDIDAVLNLEFEHKKLSTTLGVIDQTTDRLVKAFLRAKANEAMAGMPDALKVVDSLLDAEIELRQKLQQARAATDSKLTDIRRARSDCRLVGVNPKAGTAAQLSRYLDARDIVKDSKNGFGRDGHIVTRTADDLGLESPDDRPRFAEIG